MVNQRGDLKVADFGIARSLNESVSVMTMQRGRSGTLLYMSPQQLEGERGTHLDDIYSLGASLYELITSKPPFYFGNIDRQISEKTPPRMTDRRRELEIEAGPIDATWEDIVRACLAKEPARRPQSVTEIAKQLAIPSTKTPRRQQAEVKQSKKRVGLFLVATVMLGIVAIGGWSFGFFENFGKYRNTTTATPPASEQKPSSKTAVAVTPAPIIPAVLPSATTPVPIAETSPTVAPKPSPSPRKKSTPTAQTSREPFLYDGGFPYAKRVPGKPGYVISPFHPDGYVDVRGFPSGTEVKDPFSGKIFLVP